MRVSRKSFQQEICTIGYEIATMDYLADGAINVVMPRERRNYRDKLRCIAVEDEMMGIIQAYMSLRTSSREDWLGFADIYGLPNPKIANQYPKIDGMVNVRTAYPCEAIHWYDRNFEQCRIQDALQDQRIPIELVNEHCTLECGESQGSPILELRPKNLVGAMAAYITDRISEGGMFKKCEECDEWFLVADGRAKRAKYCRPACKMRAHRLK